MSKIKLEDLICINENIDLDKYIEFRKYVQKNMEHPEWLGDFTKEELTSMLKNNSKIWIYYLNNDPVCSMMFIPSTEKDLTKFEINLDYKVVGDYGPMFVNQKYVGNSLQYQMIKELNKYTLKNEYKYAASTIHPDNIFSIKNFLKDEFELVNQKEFKRGLRNIYLKKL